MVGACGDLGGDSARKIQKYYIRSETKDTRLLASFASSFASLAMKIFDRREREGSLRAQGKSSKPCVG
jgi:hypothetical protein